MSQYWNTDVYDKDARSADIIMQDVEKMFDTLKSSFSGGSAPSDPVAFMPWGDRSSGHEIMKRRNDANDAWLAILCGDANMKIWAYRNDTCEGWVVDATVTDRVLAIKGGSDAYDVNGGVNAGTWMQPGHVLTESEMPEHTHNIFCLEYPPVPPSGAGINSYSVESLAGEISTNSIGGSESHNHGDTYRPAAAVGTLQYPDL